MKNHYTIHEIIKFNEGIRTTLSGICEPIFSSFGFTNFGYTRVQKNGERLIIETNEDWLNYYADNTFEEKKEGQTSLLSNIESLIINPPPEEFHIQMLIGAPKSAFHEQLCALKIWNSVSIYVDMKNYVEVYHLAKSEVDSGAIIDLCVNKKFLLHRFFHYFREKLQLLDIEKAPSIFNMELKKIFMNHSIKTSNFTDDSISKYMEQTHVDKFYLRTHDIFIGKREAECLHYIALGRTCKEIAKILNLSPRTVESYINTLKTKTNSHLKSSIIRLAYDNLLATPGLFDDKN